MRAIEFVPWRPRIWTIVTGGTLIYSIPEDVCLRRSKYDVPTRNNQFGRGWINVRERTSNSHHYYESRGFQRGPFGRSTVQTLKLLTTAPFTTLAFPMIEYKVSTHGICLTKGPYYLLSQRRNGMNYSTRLRKIPCKVEKVHT